MPCYYPMQGYRSKELTAKGKRKLVFNPKFAIGNESLFRVTVPCGQCIGCRLERSRQWAVRCVHEAQMHEYNCFITLTYSNDFLPDDMSLDVSHFQKFMKRLRRRITDPDDRFFISTDFKVRFFHCGEYGDRFRRPHYHAILFGIDFPDKVFLKEDNGQRLYRSSILEELWPFGHSSVGSATFESAAYVARYLLKKVNGDAAIDHYVTDVNPFTGEVFKLRPEYTTMSRRPGIGKTWFDEFGSDVFPRDEVVVRKKKMRPPKYYDTQYELSYPEDMERIKYDRKRSARVHEDNCTPDRLAVRRRVKELQISALVRNVDMEL